MQVLKYVPDVGRALAELYPVVRPGGAVVLVDTDWRSCVAHDGPRPHRRLLTAWEDPQLPAAMLTLLRRAGFARARIRPLPVVETEPASAAYSVGMADTIAGFVARRQPELAAAWRDDDQGRPDDYFFSLTRFAAVATR